MTESFHDRIERTMTALIRDLLGSGYVPDYYRNLAGPFVAACEQFIEEAMTTEGET